MDYFESKIGFILAIGFLIVFSFVAGQLTVFKWRGTECSQCHLSTMAIAEKLGATDCVNHGLRYVRSSYSGVVVPVWNDDDWELCMTPEDYSKWEMAQIPRKECKELK